jgi:VanZ family protein
VHGKMTHKYLIYPIGYMLIIFTLSSIPMDRQIEGLNLLINLDSDLQNFLHIPLFGYLAVLWIKALGKHNKRYSRTIFWTLTITILFAIFDEIYQYFIPGRFASFMDVILNLMGSLFGVAVYSGYLRKSSRRLNEC